jgi:hypothetical protein
MDLVDHIMPTSTSTDAPIAIAYMVWNAVHDLFNDNKKTHEVYLAKEFRNVKQVDLSVGEYLNRQKAAADALADVGAPVSDSDLITNIIKGLDELFNSIADIAPLLTPFPTFLNFCNMLLLQEMKVAHRTANTSTSAFVAKVPTPPPPATGPPPPDTSEGQKWHANPITEAMARTRATSSPLPLPRPLRTTHGPAPFRCGLCRSLPVTASSDLA